MNSLNFDEAAMKFVRDHKHCMTMQDVKAAMEIGAAMMALALTEAIKKTSEQMRKERAT